MKVIGGIQTSDGRKPISRLRRTECADILSMNDIAFDPLATKDFMKSIIKGSEIDVPASVAKIAEYRAERIQKKNDAANSEEVVQPKDGDLILLHQRSIGELRTLAKTMGLKQSPTNTKSELVKMIEEERDGNHAA